MSNIYINHPSIDFQESLLAADVAAAATSSTVENNKSFGTNDYVVFGTPKEELTEIVLLTSTTGNTTLGHTTGPVFAHNARTSVSIIKYNQAKIYSATSEDGSYSLLATVDLTLDQDFTVYDDTTGTTATWYKIKYYNETTAALSAFSSAIQASGYTEDSLYDMASEVLEDFGDEGGRDLSREQVYNYLRGGARKVINKIFIAYPDFLKTYAAQALTSGTASLPSRFLGFFRVDAGTTATTAYKAEFIEEADLYPGSTYSSSRPLVYIRGSSFYVLPTDVTNAYLWYWSYPAIMTTDTSEHGLPYGARDVLVNYALYRAWLSKDVDRSGSYKSLYKDGLDDLIEFIVSSRQTMDAKHTKITSGAEMYEFYD